MKKLFILFGLSYLTVGAANGINGEVITKVGTTGTVQLPGSQTTNLTISLVSKVTDGASAVAFSLNSSNALTTGKLMDVRNFGYSVFSIQPGGATNATSAILSGISSVINLSVDDAGSSSVALSATGGNINAAIDPTGPILNLFGNNAGILLYPGNADGSAIATFDTFGITHTSGNLAEFKNNGTLAISIGATNNNLVLSGTTNQIVFGSTNTAPSSSLAPVKWISVQVQGETEIYRTPLYK